MIVEDGRQQDEVGPVVQDSMTNLTIPIRYVHLVQIESGYGAKTAATLVRDRNCEMMPSYFGDTLVEPGWAGIEKRLHHFKLGTQRQVEPTFPLGL